MMILTFVVLSIDLFIFHTAPRCNKYHIFRNEQIHLYDTRDRKELHPIKIKTKLYGEKPFHSKREIAGTNYQVILKK